MFLSYISDILILIIGVNESFDIVQVWSAVKVLLGNEKSLLVPQWYLYQKNKVYKSLASVYHSCTFNPG